jgi:gliding motility-associated-like protein
MALTDNSVNASSWLWDINNNGTIDYTTQNSSYSFSVPVNYPIALITASDEGCLDTIIQAINVPDIVLTVYIPNAFSPNDDGLDDMYYVFGKCFVEINFSVYDRWGEKVFQTNDINHGWDGRYKGKMENAGVFMYYFDGKLITGETIKQNGNITLMR